MHSYQISIGASQHPSYHLEALTPLYQRRECSTSYLVAVMLLVQSIFCTQVFELKTTQPPPSVSTSALQMPQIASIDPMVLQTQPVKLMGSSMISLPNNIDLFGYAGYGQQSLKIFNSDMQLVAVKDTDVPITAQLVGMVYSSLHQKIWIGARGDGGPKSTTVQYMPGSTDPTSSIALSSWKSISLTLVWPDARPEVLIGFSLHLNTNYLYTYQQPEEIPATAQTEFQTSGFCRHDITLETKTYISYGAPITVLDQGVPECKLRFFSDTHAVMLQTIFASGTLLFYDVSTATPLKPATIHEGFGTIQDIVVESLDSSHTYMIATKAIYVEDPVQKTLVDLNCQKFLTDPNPDIQSAASLNHPIIQFGNDPGLLHGQNLLDFRLFGLLGVTTGYSSDQSVFDGTKLYLTLISKATFTVIPADYVLGEPLTFSAFSLLGGAYTNQSISFGGLLHKDGVLQFQAYQLSFASCEPIDSSLIKLTEVNLQKDYLADVKTNCLDTRCSSGNCSLSLKTIGELSRENMVGCVTFEFDLFVRNEPKEFSFSLYDLLKKETVPINSNLISVVWSSTSVCFNATKALEFFEELDVYEGNFLVNPKDIFPVRSSNLQRRFELFPITLKVTYL